MQRILGAVLTAGVIGSFAYAPAAYAGPSAPTPTAGSLMTDNKQKQDVPTDIVKTPDADVNVADEERPPMNVPDELKVQVNDFKITGQTGTYTDKLMAIAAPNKGKLMTFGDLRQVGDQMTNYLKAQGFIASKVLLPAQKITNGVVEYSVVIGQFDGITIENHTDIHEDALQREISFLKKGDFIRKTEIERAVWLLSDLAGADAKMTISPGTQSGTSNLLIVLNPHNGKNGTFFMDNYGNRYTGYGEYGFTYDVLNPVREGDHLAMDFTTTGHGIINGSLNYTIPVIRDGLTFNAGYSHLDYHLGSEFDVLDAYGRSDVYHIGMDYAIQRSQRHNLYAGIRLEHSKISDTYGNIPLLGEYNDKHGNAGVLSLYGDEQDSKGATAWRLDYKLGTIGFDNNMTHYLYGNTGIEGGYSKVNFNILRRQDLTNRLYVLLSARGQYASHNLDSSEDFSLGGISGVRAYPTSEASGDVGYCTRAELRWLLPLKKQDQTLQLAAYLDHGGVRIDKSGGNDNYRKLQGIGVGLIWSRKDDWWLRTDYAWRLGADGERPRSDTTCSNGHFWIQGGVYF